MTVHVLMWSGIVALYLGIAGAVGIFSRQAIIEAYGAKDRILAAIYSMALFLPSSALIVAMVQPPLRAGLLIIAMAVVCLAFAQPRWIPEFVWQRTFTHHYLASVMALAALWGIVQAQGGASMAPLLITISAVAAAAASSGATLRTPSIKAK